MKIREVIVENDEEDMFGQSDRVGKDLRRVTYQQRIPSMVKMIQGGLDANAGPFAKRLSANLGADASVFRRDPEIFELANHLLTQEVMSQVSNILMSLDSAVISDEDELNDALTDLVSNIRAESELWNYIGEVIGDDGADDEVYACAMDIEGEIGALLLKLIQQAYNQFSLAEAFNNPYKGKWEKSEYDDSVDMLVKLPDGSNLSIMFNMEYDRDGEEVVQVEFWRNNSQDVTGEGDAQRIFATVLDAIQKYIKKYKPERLSFSASKALDMDADDVEHFNPESRAKLYDRLIQRYAGTWGYRASRTDNGDIVIYELSRITQGVAEGKQPGKPVVDAILKVMPVTQEIWFHGSRATGRHRRNSDTDILVVVPDDLVGDQYLAVVRILQKLASHFDNYDIQPTKAGTNIHRIAQEEGRLLWSSKPGVAEGSENFNGIDIDMEIEGDEIMVRAMANGRELGHVLFVEDGEYLMPQDLEVDERFQGQGIAATMYDYVKSKGYKIRRSGQQTDAGAGFWRKHRPEQNVWENFHDGQNPQDKGDSKRHGVPTKASISTLRKVAKQGGRKGQLAHWMANMKSGRAKAKRK